MRDTMLALAVLLGCSSAPATPKPAQGAPLTLPGTCNPVEQQVRVRRHPEPMADLDGDGTADTLVIDCKAMHSCTPILFVMRGGCGHLVGRLEGGTSPTVKVLATRTGGLADVVESLPDEMTGKPVDTTFTFDGTQYVAKK